MSFFFFFPLSSTGDKISSWVPLGLKYGYSAKRWTNCRLYGINTSNIISALFYSCQQSNYFLRSKCARLPLKKRYQTHPHLLTLYPFRFIISNTISCDACRRFSHGFAYACFDCRYILDIQCCSLSKTLEHEGHKHSLFLPPSSIQDCNSCEGQRRHIGVFVCKECNFALGFECATLPLKVEYEHDQHPLSLTYTTENNYEK
jgi:hypothetical protein